MRCILSPAPPPTPQNYVNYRFISTNNNLPLHLILKFIFVFLLHPPPPPAPAHRLLSSSLHSFCAPGSRLCVCVCVGGGDGGVVVVVVRNTILCLCSLLLLSFHFPDAVKRCVPNPCWWDIPRYRNDFYYYYLNLFVSLVQCTDFRCFGAKFAHPVISPPKVWTFGIFWHWPTKPNRENNQLQCILEKNLSWYKYVWKQIKMSMKKYWYLFCFFKFCFLFFYSYLEIWWDLNHYERHLFSAGKGTVA